MPPETCEVCGAATGCRHLRRLATAEALRQRLDVAESPALPLVQRPWERHDEAEPIAVVVMLHPDVVAELEVDAAGEPLADYLRLLCCGFAGASKRTRTLGTRGPSALADLDAAVGEAA